MPCACPIRATPAAEPMDSSDPPTPAVSVTSSHWPCDISGFIASTANMIGMLSMMADASPTATLVVEGDAKAVADGYPPVTSPSAAEVQAVLATAIAESNDVPLADAAYDEAQAAVDALRGKADSLIKAVRAAIIYSTYEMDPPSQRRVLRHYGSVYRYLSGETVDEGDTTAVVEDGV